jgi:hypothetical protein
MRSGAALPEAEARVDASAAATLKKRRRVGSKPGIGSDSEIFSAYIPPVEI